MARQCLTDSCWTALDYMPGSKKIGTIKSGARVEVLESRSTVKNGSAVSLYASLRLIPDVVSNAESQTDGRCGVVLEQERRLRVRQSGDGVLQPLTGWVSVSVRVNTIQHAQCCLEMQLMSRPVAAHAGAHRKGPRGGGANVGDRRGQSPDRSSSRCRQIVDGYRRTFASDSVAAATGSAQAARTKRTQGHQAQTW